MAYPNIVRSFEDPKNNRRVGQDDQGKFWQQPLRGLSGDVPWDAIISVGSSIVNKVLSPTQMQAQSQPASVPAYPDYAAQAAQFNAQLQAQQIAAQQAAALAQAQAELKAAQDRQNQLQTAVAVPATPFTPTNILLGAAVVGGLLVFLNSQRR